LRLESLDIDDPDEARAELGVLAEQLRAGGWNVEVAGPGEPTLSRFRESAEGAFVDVLNLVLDEAERHAVDAVLAAVFAWAVDRLRFRGREGARPVIVIYVGDEDVREEPLPGPRTPISTGREETRPPPVPDFSRLARKPSELLAIVTYVRSTPGFQETEYLEWKSGYDLSTRPGAAATARQLIGMANRDGARAATHAEGHAYILLGVEPGGAPGVPLWDASDIENWLTPFVGPDLRYEVHYAPFAGQQVLFLTVDAPRAGDPIYNLQKAREDPGGAALPAGTIYVRHGANTTRHTPADLARLTARATVAPVTTLDVAVEPDASGVAAIDAALLADGSRDQRLASWRTDMLAAMPRQEASSPLGFAYQQVGVFGERRSRQEYASEVDLHVQTITATRHFWWAMVAQEWLEAGRSVLGVSVVNSSEENYEDTVVELTFGLPRFCVFLRPRDVKEVMRPPDPPAKWGRALADISSRSVIAQRLRDPEPEIERAGQGETLVRYPELRVRPHTTHAMKPLLLALGPPMAGTAILVRWRVTASNTKSDLSGHIELRVPGGPQPARSEVDESPG